MSVSSRFCEFDKETRKYLKKRDNNKCVICHKRGALQAMHIFVSRASGGKGCKENGCLGCIQCHTIIDNPLGDKQNKLSIKYLNYCKEYLIEKENITNVPELLKKLKYDKTTYLRSVVKAETPIKKIENKCRDCIMLEKREIKNSTIPIYYCKYKNMRVHKNKEVCENIKRK